MAGLCAGRGRIPHRHRQSRTILCAQSPGRERSDFRHRAKQAALWAGVHHAFQHVSLGPDQRHRRRGLQLLAGHGRDGGSLRPDHAEGNGLQLPRYVIPGKESRARRVARGHLRPRSGLRLPHPRRAIRKLVASVQRPPRHAHRRLRRVFRALGARHGKQCLRADRTHHAHRPRCKECHPHRRVLQSGIRKRKKSLRRSAGRGAHTVASDSHDRLRLHSRLCPALDRHRIRIHLASDHGHGRDRRHDRSHDLRHLYHSDAFLRGGKTLGLQAG